MRDILEAFADGRAIVYNLAILQNSTPTSETWSKRIKTLVESELYFPEGEGPLPCSWLS